MYCRCAARIFIVIPAKSPRPNLKFVVLCADVYDVFFAESVGLLTNVFHSAVGARSVLKFAAAYYVDVYDSRCVPRIEDGWFSIIPVRQTLVVSVGKQKHKRSYTGCRRR